MRIAIAFDTLAYAKELETAGVPPPQAEAQAKALFGILQKVEESRLQELATKRDVRELERKLEVKIETAKNEILKWVVGLMLAQTGLIIAAIKLIPGS